MPTEEDQPDENFFFNAGTPGGRLRLDLNEVKTIQQINTYPGTPARAALRLQGLWRHRLQRRVQSCPQERNRPRHLRVDSHRLG